MSRGKRTRLTRPILYQVGDTVRVLDTDPPLPTMVTAIRADQVRVSYHDHDGDHVNRWVELASARPRAQWGEAFTMRPPARFIYQHHTTTGSWVVVDRLVGRTIHLAADLLSAADIALDEELTWRRACERWQREEQREGPPPAIF